MEQISNFSGRPSALVLRPADSAETLEAYKLAMENVHSPSILIFSRQNLEDLPSDNRREEAKKTAGGGYVVVDAENPEVVLVGNGSDVALLVHAAEELKNEGVAARVVSVPSIGLFNSQSEEYRRSVIPAGVRLFRTYLRSSRDSLSAA